MWDEVEDAILGLTVARVGVKEDTHRVREAVVAAKGSSKTLLVAMTSKERRYCCGGGYRILGPWEKVDESSVLQVYRAQRVV